MAGNGNGRKVKGKVPDKSGRTGRNPDGTFAPGNGGMGGGRPKSRRSKVMEDAWDEQLTPARARRIVRKCIACALRGESWAHKEINDRSIGKPKESLEVSGSLTLTELYHALGTHLRAV